MASISAAEEFLQFRAGQEGLYWGPLEDDLKDRFSALTEDLELPAIVQLEPGRALPKKLPDYRLAPLVTESAVFHSSDSARTLLEVPDDVTVHYGDHDWNPYLDSSLAIGLVYRGLLTALASGQTTPEGNLGIVQLQGAYKFRDGRKIGYESGLHGGFLWRHTLVQAWLELGQQLGAPAVEVQGALNNRYKNSERLMNMTRGYDEVAREMGFALTADGNWQKPITEA